MMPSVPTVSRLSLMLAIVLCAGMVAPCQHPDFQEIQTVPQLISPRDNETVYDSVITFSWQHDAQGQEGLVYELWVDEAMVGEVDGGKDKSLYTGTVYIPFKLDCQPANWLIRMRSNYQYNNSKSGSFHFVCMDPPVLMAPEDKYCFEQPTENKLDNVHLKWSHETRNDPNLVYEVWVNDEQIGLIEKPDSESIHTYILNLSPSVECMEYNWYIVAKNLFQSEESTHQYFKILYTKPVSLLFPEDQKSFPCRENISFEWENYSCYDTYQLTIQNVDYPEDIFEADDLTTTNFIGQLATEGTYTWWVKGMIKKNVVDVFDQRTLAITPCDCALSRLTVEENDVFDTYPPLRSESAFIYDPVQNLFWLHGGYWWSYNPDPKQDTWKFDPTSWKWTDISDEVGYPTTSDGYVITQRMLKGAYDSKRQAFLVCHGIVLSRLNLNPLGKWEIIFDFNEIPSINFTDDHVEGYHEKTDMIIIIFPLNSDYYLIKYDQRNDVWYLEQKPFIEPFLYMAAHFIYHPLLDVFIYAFGIHDAAKDILNDKIYVFDPNRELWSILETVGEKPIGRAEGSAVYDSCSNKIYFISGGTTNSFDSSLYKEKILHSLYIKDGLGYWEKIVIPCKGLSFPGGAQSSALSSDGLLVNIDIKKPNIDFEYENFFSFWRIKH